MGLFNKLFRQSEKVEQANEAHTPKDTIACKTEQELLERFGGKAFDKQIDLDEVIGNNSWNVDMTKEEISFGTNLVFPIQVLGTFSHSSETWLWAWANSKSGLSDNITQQARQLKKYGEENGIDLLRVSQFDATNNDLHLIGLIASGMFNSSGYYVADYGQGAMVVTVKSDKVDKINKDNHFRILSAFPQLISHFELNHYFALTNYLTDNGYSISKNGMNITATKNGNIITAEFDEQSRLIELNG